MYYMMTIITPEMGASVSSLEVFLAVGLGLLVGLFIMLMINKKI